LAIESVASLSNRLTTEASTVVCGDFNSDGNTGVRKLLVDAVVEPAWREVRVCVRVRVRVRVRV
jgi:hypothetical protein